MTYGFVKLYRDILESPIYDNSNAIRLYIHILLKANIEDKKWNEILIKKGQFITSESKLQDELNLNRQQIRTAIKTLEKYGFIKKITTKTYTILTLKSNQEPNQEPNQELTKNQPRKNEINKEVEVIDDIEPNHNLTHNLTKNLTTTKEVKEYKEKEKELNNKTYMCVMEKWNSICFGYFPTIKLMNNKRKKQIDEILKQFDNDINVFEIVFKNLTKCNFSLGNNDRGWKADIDYILRMDKFIKFFEKENETRFKQKEIKKGGIVNTLERMMKESSMQQEDEIIDVTSFDDKYIKILINSEDYNE